MAGEKKKKKNVLNITKKKGSGFFREEGEKILIEKKIKEIRIVVHMPKQVASVFSREQAEEFWIEKISGKIRESGLTKQQRKQLADNLNH